MRIVPCLLFLLAFTFCKGQSNKSFNVNHGVVLERADTNVKKEIRIIHLAHSTGVIFPKSYGLQKFGSWTKENIDFFTPDSNLIKGIDKEINAQFVSANRRFDENVWETTFAQLRNDSVELEKARLQKAYQASRLEKFYKKDQRDLIFYDRQYLGVISHGEKLIYIQLIDFRKDPYKLKSIFTTSWIDGWHGWFETNRRTLYFHIDKKLLTVNEDI